MATVEFGATAEELQSLYREYDWWADRDTESVRRALEHTDETALLREDGDRSRPPACSRTTSTTRWCTT